MTPGPSEDIVKAVKESFGPKVLAAAPGSEVWVVTGVCSRSGRWWIHAVHQAADTAARDVEASNRNSERSVCYGASQWVVIPPNDKLSGCRAETSNDTPTP